MAVSPKIKETKHFGVFLLVLLLFSFWNAAGASIEALERIFSQVSTDFPKSMEDVQKKFETMLDIPKPVMFAVPQIKSHEADLAAAKIAAELKPQGRPPFPLLAGKKNPFFPSWVESILVPEGLSSKDTRITEAAPKDELYIFTGIVKLKDQEPVAVIRDQQENLSVFLAKGEVYKVIMAKEITLKGVVFDVQGTSYKFDTLHHTAKTIRVGRHVRKPQPPR